MISRAGSPSADGRREVSRRRSQRFKGGGDLAAVGMFTKAISASWELTTPSRIDSTTSARTFAARVAVSASSRSWPAVRASLTWAVTSTSDSDANCWTDLPIPYHQSAAVPRHRRSYGTPARSGRPRPVPPSCRVRRTVRDGRQPVARFARRGQVAPQRAPFQGADLPHAQGQAGCRGAFFDGAGIW